MSALPPRPDFKHLRQQAKDLQKAYVAADRKAVALVKKFLSRAPRSAKKLSLADAQFVIARDYGFESWPKLKRRVEELSPPKETKPPIEQFKDAINNRDAAKLKKILKQHAEVKAQINAPLFSFDTPAIVAGKSSREVVDVLLDNGANINERSKWWAGSFGVLDNCDPETAECLIKRGAKLDIHSAAALGMLDKVKEFVERDPALVNAKGGDGQRPLHVAKTTEIIDYLLEHGAEIDARDVDHGSTPAQYLIQDPVRCGHLIKRGATPDIFIACTLGDVELVKRCLAMDPNCANARVGEGEFVSKDSSGGHIYLYTIGQTARPILVAAKHKHRAVVELLLQNSPPAERFLVACSQADEKAIRAMLKKQPDLVKTLTPEQSALVSEAAWEGRADAVRAMLDAGFDVNARNREGMAALHSAAVWGNLPLVEMILKHQPDLTLKNNHGGTALSTCAWGSMNFKAKAGRYAECAERLIQAGSEIPERWSGSPEVAAVLGRYAKKKP
jgi:ankyrin repeat protein